MFPYVRQCSSLGLANNRARVSPVSPPRDWPLGVHRKKCATKTHETRPRRVTTEVMVSIRFLGISPCRCPLREGFLFLILPNGKRKRLAGSGQGRHDPYSGGPPPSVSFSTRAPGKQNKRPEARSSTGSRPSAIGGVGTAPSECWLRQPTNSDRRYSAMQRKRSCLPN